MSLALAVERMERERDELRGLNDLLAARVAQLEDLHDRELSEKLRAAYRRGYLTGRAAKRRGAGAVTNPERAARGDLGRMLR